VYISLGFHGSAYACYLCRINAAARHSGEEISVEHVEIEDVLNGIDAADEFSHV